MPIPLYNQQVGAPKPPRLREDARGKMARVAAAGQFAQQAAGAISGFAGQLADLAAQNELNQSVIKANDQWREFWADLQKNPEYTTFQEQFDTFYRGVHDDLYGEIRLPRAKMALETRMAELKSGWEDKVRQYSDNRAIDHARAITQQSVNQAIKDMDVDRVLTEIRSAQESMLYTEEDIVKIQNAALNEIIRDKTMNYARVLGDEGMLWLMGDEAKKKFAVELDGIEYSLEPEKLNAMAVELGTERSNRKKAEDAATWQARKTMVDYVLEQIESGKLTSVEQLYDDEYQEEFTNRHGFILDLNDEDKAGVNQILADRAEEFEKDREAYSDDMLGAVSDAIKAGDAETAKRYLDELIDEGYAHDARGRVDPEIRRYIEQYNRMQAGGEITDFDREANRLWGRIRDKEFAGMREDLAQFLEQFPSKEGREEHQQLLNELQTEEARARTEAREKQDQEDMRPEYDEYFYARYDVFDITLDQLEALDRWRYENYPTNKKDPSRPGIDTTTWRTYGRLIEAKKKELKAPEIARRKTVVGAGEKKIIDWYATEIRDKNQNEANRLRTERDNKVAEYHDLLREKEMGDPAALADFLLTDPQKEKVKRNLGLFSGKREETDIEYYTRLGIPEMIPGEQRAAAAAQEYSTARRTEALAIPPTQLVPPKQPIVAGAEERLRAKYKNYRIDPQHGGLATSAVYNNRPANPGYVWAFNEETQKVEMISMDDVLRFNQANK